MSKEQIFDVAVIGAGPVGGTLALLLAKAGFKTCLIDQRDPDTPRRPDGRNFAIVRGSWRVLRAAGLTQRLSDDLQPLNGLEAEDGGTHFFGAPSVAFGNSDLPESDDKLPLGYMIPAMEISLAQDAAIENQDNLTFIAPASFERIDNGPALSKLHLKDGRVITARCVAGCDGVNSPLREALKISTEGRDYNKSVFTANVHLDTPHRGIARQLFTPEGPFATLPLKGQRANLAWYMKRGAAEALAQCAPEAIDAELNKRFASFAGSMRLDGAALSYPLHLKIATDVTKERCVLVGDAAHRVNPLAGQGLNLGFKDIAALVEVLEDARYVGLDIGAPTVLKRYSNMRRFDSTMTALGLDMIDRLWSNDSAILKPVRGMAMFAAQKLPPLRTRLAQFASADSDALPRLMRE